MLTNENLYLRRNFLNLSRNFLWAIMMKWNLWRMTRPFTLDPREGNNQFYHLLCFSLGLRDRILNCCEVVVDISFQVPGWRFFLLQVKLFLQCSQFVDLGNVVLFAEDSTFFFFSFSRILVQRRWWVRHDFACIQCNQPSWELEHPRVATHIASWFTPDGSC